MVETTSTTKQLFKCRQKLLQLDEAIFDIREEWDSDEPDGMKIELMLLQIHVSLTNTLNYSLP